MVLISAGVIIASAGEVHFNIIGVFFQISGSMAEALRLVLTQVLLQKKGLSLNPLTSLYYIAPCRYGAHQDCSFTFWTFLCWFERKRYVHLNLGWCSFAFLAISCANGRWGWYYTWGGHLQEQQMQRKLERKSSDLTTFDNTEGKEMTIIPTELLVIYETHVRRSRAWLSWLSITLFCWLTLVWPFIFFRIQTKVMRATLFRKQ